MIVSPYLYYAFQPGGLPILLSRTDMFSNDLLAFVTPLPDIARRITSHPQVVHCGLDRGRRVFRPPPDRDDRPRRASGAGAESTAKSWS